MPTPQLFDLIPKRAAEGRLFFDEATPFRDHAVISPYPEL